MPAVQSKRNFDGKPKTEDDNVKMKSATKTRNKDRNTSRKNENTLERNLRQKKKVIVPELDLKSVRVKSHNKKNHNESSRKTKIHPLAATTAAKLSNKPQLGIRDAYLKSNKDVVTPDSGSLSPPRKEPNSSLGDVENINPNQQSDSYYDCCESKDIEFFRSQNPDNENSSELGYETPKLLDDLPLPSIKSMTSSDMNRSPGVLRHFTDLLHQEETSRTNMLKQSEVALLKDIVKADQRHRRLRRDDYKLLKEIMVDQLKEICQQERVIKIALKKIRSRREDQVEVTTLKVDSAEQPMEDTPKSVRSVKDSSKKLISKHSHRLANRTPRTDYELMMKGIQSAVSNDTFNSHRAQRQEVDIIFKNVPSLEKEIRILRTLGMKLEETLNKSTEMTVPVAIVLHEIQERHIGQILYYACSDIHPKGIKSLSGQAQEFQIRHQTIDELKLEREFFIPTDIDNFTLQRTDFHKLMNNPELLLRRLRPFSKGSAMKFNFIDQDPIFFNHFLSKMCNIYSETSDCYGSFLPQGLDFLKNKYQQDLHFVKNGSGDHHPDVDLKVESPQNPEVTVPELHTLSNSSVGKRKKKKRHSTPIASEKVATSKNRLMRNIFFGILQLAMLFTFAVAIWYPDINCL